MSHIFNPEILYIYTMRCSTNHLLTSLHTCEKMKIHVISVKVSLSLFPVHSKDSTELIKFTTCLATTSGSSLD